MIAALTNHLWQSTLFAAAVAALAFCLRRNGAHVRHALWLTASLKFLVPFALLLNFGASLGWPAAAPSGDAPPSPPVVSVVMDQIAQPFPSTFEPTPPAAASVDWTPIALTALWFCGFVAIILWRALAWRRIRATVKAATALRLPIRAILNRRFAIPDSRFPIDVLSCPGLLEPGVVGLWRPILLLPAGIQDRLTPPQLDAVLAHELCHIRRHDNVTAAMHMVVEALFWFHPLVWWIGARMVDERERACDEHVLTTLGQPDVYAEGILSVCKHYVESPLKCVSGVTGSNLKKRIEAIMINRTGLRLNFARRAGVTTAAFLALAAPIVVGMITAPIRARAQAATAGAEFEVVSIKPCSSERSLPPPAGAGSGSGGGARQGGSSTFTSSPGRVHIECGQLTAIVDAAYIRRGPDAAQFSGWAGTGNSYNGRATEPQKIRGGPSWVYDDRWTIEAKAETAVDEDTMMGPMLRALLEDRFQLKLHTNTEEVPMWTLNVAKSGLKIKPLKDGECNPDRTEGGVQVSRAIKEGIKPTCGMVSGAPDGANWRWEHGGQGLGAVASMLSLDLGAAVLDRTGVTGKFNIMWEYGPDENTPTTLRTMQRFAPDSGRPTAANVFTALEDQLGLKLEKIKGPRGYIVIDRVERPTPDSPSPFTPSARPRGQGGS